MRPSPPNGDRGDAPWSTCRRPNPASLNYLDRSGGSRAAGEGTPGEPASSLAIVGRGIPDFAATDFRMSRSRIIDHPHGPRRATWDFIFLGFRGKARPCHP
jgi:hypothetical protein